MTKISRNFRAKCTNGGGFTLAELLIVVAIIAVMVAIAIPTFSSQLEKSREGTDISNIRAAYAAVAAEAMTSPNTALEVKVTLVQTVNGWQSANTISIAGVALSSINIDPLPEDGIAVAYTPAASGTGNGGGTFKIGGVDVPDKFGFSDSDNEGDDNEPTAADLAVSGTGYDSSTQTLTVVYTQNAVDDTKGDFSANIKSLVTAQRGTLSFTFANATDYTTDTTAGTISGQVTIADLPDDITVTITDMVTATEAPSTNYAETSTGSGQYKMEKTITIAFSDGT